MRLSIRTPIHREGCYECGGSWRLQWPVAMRRRPRALSTLGEATLQVLIANTRAIFEYNSPMQMAAGVVMHIPRVTPP
jgi:hypothetical protein